MPLSDQKKSENARIRELGRIATEVRRAKLKVDKAEKHARLHPPKLPINERVAIRVEKSKKVKLARERIRIELSEEKRQLKLAHTILVSSRLHATSAQIKADKAALRAKLRGANIRAINKAKKPLAP